jgi:hypothetical protein
VLQHGPGQFLDPLVGGAADPAAVAVSRGGQRPVGDASGEIEDRADVAGVAVRGRRRLVDDRPRFPVAFAESLRALGITLHLLGRTEVADADWREALEIFKRLGTLDTDPAAPTSGSRAAAATELAERIRRPRPASVA